MGLPTASSNRTTLISTEIEGSAIAIIIGAITLLAVIEAEILALREKYTVHLMVSASSAL
jgi:hypothetical protein